MESLPAKIPLGFVRQINWIVTFGYQLQDLEWSDFGPIVFLKARLAWPGFQGEFLIIRSRCDWVLHRWFGPMAQYLTL
jgi:hypothetical protein